MKRLRIFTLFLFVGAVCASPASACAKKNFLRGFQRPPKAASAWKSSVKVNRYQLMRFAGKRQFGNFSSALGASRVAGPTKLLRTAFNASPSFSRFSDGKRLAVPFPGKQVADAIIFDLDGTLLDSLSAWEHSGTNFLRAQGITPPEGLDDVLVKMSLMDGARLVKEQFGLLESPEEILRQTLEPVRRRYFEDIAAKPGVPQMLLRLKQEGVKLCIATASDRELAEGALERLGLLEFFDFIVTCDEVGVGKRSPAVYEEALRRLGTDKSRTLVAEDARYALETAQKAGFATVGVADSHTPAADTEKIREAADFYVEHFLHGVFEK